MTWSSLRLLKAFAYWILFNIGLRLAHILGKIIQKCFLFTKLKKEIKLNISTSSLSGDMLAGHLIPSTLPIQRVYAQSFFWRRNPTKTLGCLPPWISPWFFVGFLLSPPHSMQRKPSSKLSCFGGFFSLGFLNPSNCLVFLELLQAETRTK